MASEIKLQLREVLAEQRAWRSRKADEYPEDPRNIASVAAIDQFAAYVAALPDDDPRLMSLAAIGSPVDVYLASEQGAQIIARLGFDDWPNEGLVLDAFVAAEIDAEAARNSELLDEAE